MKPSIELKFYKYEKSERADSSNPFLFFSYLQPSNLLLKCLLLMLSVLNNLSITQLLPIFSSKYLPSQSLLASSGIGTRQTSTTPVNPWESLCFSLMRRYTHLPRKGYGAYFCNPVHRPNNFYVHQMADVVGQIQSVKGYGLTNPQVISPLLISFLIEPSHDKTWINDQQVSSIGDLNMFLSNTTDQVNGRDGNHGSGPRVWPVKDCRGTVLEQESEKKSILVTFPPENTRSSDDEDSRSGDDDSSSGDDDPSSSDDDSSSGGVLICEKLPQCIAELGGKEFIFHIRVTPFNFTPTHRTFTVSAISHTINTENYKINESPCVDVKCEEASTSASAIKMSTAEVKQGGCKLPHQLCNIFHLFKKSISTMYLT
ncbi:BnaC05g17680D [Brassica napus]|uniref:BnaC05g17680D protein n=1 Tax=Brassica napus TaxID=3708 RepID=A0A078HKR9_BRANA|nr:BnaC05g17680D [Brassica napus]